MNNVNLATVQVNHTETCNEPILRKLTASHTISIKNLDVYIEDQHILQDINLTIPEKKHNLYNRPFWLRKINPVKNSQQDA